MKDIKIGLEIHGYLVTKEKLFCQCRASRHNLKQNVRPNTYVCPVCCGMPGAKPMLPNEQAVRKIIEIGLMLGCKINNKLIWQRKHYNWPDLPKGYQNTISGAYSIPLGELGHFAGIGITECHLEEDPASWNPETGEIDYNRSGLPLVEIVTEPEFSKAEEVAEFLNKLILTLSYIKAIDSNAGLKVDVNISIGKEKGKERVEVKNLSSIEAIKQAIEYEIKRQEKEGTLRETRRFDENKNITIRMRSKEEQEDYRFIPDPDLPVLKIDDKLIHELREQLPESPDEKLNKLIKKHKIPEKEAKILAGNFDLVEFFEKVIKKIKPEVALHWVTGELLSALNYAKKTLNEVEIEAEHFIELLDLKEKGKITELKAKQILYKFVPKSFSPKKEAEKESRISDEKGIEKFVKAALEKNPEAVSDYKAGKKEAFNFLLGKVMELSGRRADFKIARKVLEKKLK
jgi:aspartyl-tRNA(Asn)/glutamyl-tRNA(Gln) amidotransferase subunit B